ncbi:MAG: hypothetical protein IPF66_02780 [Holophagales bacterium]|nr:hypothetical protein [Holophagales bacterium]
MTVQLQDAGANPVAIAGTTITLTLTSGNGTLSGTASRVTNASGLATFDDLSIDLAGSKVLTAASAGLTSAVSSSFTITAGPASQLAYVQPPTPTAPGATITPAVTVQLQDAAGNPVSFGGTTITLSLTSGNGTLSGTTSQPTNASGLATFADLSIDLAGSKVLTAASAGLASAVSSAFSITAATATQLAYVQQPTNAAAEATIAPAVTVQLQDAGANPVAIAGTTITLSLTSGNGTLSGTASRVTNASGLATFDDLSIDLAGSKGADGGERGPDVGGLELLHHHGRAGQPARLRPATDAHGSRGDDHSGGDGAAAGRRRQPGVLRRHDDHAQPHERKRHPLGHDEPADERGGPGDLRRPLDRPRRLQGADGGERGPGVGRLERLQHHGRARHPAGLRPAAAERGGRGHDRPAVTVQLQDAGAPVAIAGTTITLTLTSGNGTLSGTTSRVTNASGLATFDDLSIDLAGSKVLTAASAGLTSAVSSSFNITAGPASQLAYVQPPTPTAPGRRSLRR